MKSSRHALINLCTPLINQLSVLQSKKSQYLSENFGNELFEALLRLEHLGLESQIPCHQTNDAKYALAALLDEAIMRSEWPGKLRWMDQSLQSRLFGEHLAGVNFFNRLARIRQSGELNIAVLEVYFVCLQLGFQGKYAMSQEEELKALQVDIKHQLDLYRGEFNASLSLELQGIPDITQIAKRKLPDWAWCGLFLLSLALLYSVYALRLGELHRTHQALVEQAISRLNVY